MFEIRSRPVPWTPTGRVAAAADGCHGDAIVDRCGDMPVY